MATMDGKLPVQKRPQNCGTSYCSCIECVMEPTPVQEPDEWLTGCPECGMDSGCDCDSGTWNPPAAPVVPDVMTTAEGEHPEYVQGWNDCRQLMLQTRNNRHD